MLEHVMADMRRLQIVPKLLNEGHDVLPQPS
jgi:hypothetical protein